MAGLASQSARVTKCYWLNVRPNEILCNDDSSFQLSLVRPLTSS